MTIFRNLFLHIGGDSERFELEHRIFNISSFLITTFGLIGGVGNYLTGLSLMTVWLSVLGMVVSGYLFYLARVKEIFTLGVVFIYLAAVVFVLGLMFFFNGGVQGTILYLIIMLLTIFLLIVPSVYQNFVGVVLYATLLLLIILEFVFPEWITAYHSNDEMLLDHVLTIFYAVFFTTIVIRIFRKKYLEDRAQMLQQNTSLKLLNDKVIAQKNEMEEKTRLLEIAIERANERNNYIEMLMKELNHRVKNNLQLVSSLLLKQANSSTDPATKEALLDTKNRLLSLILLHQRLYGPENTVNIFIPRYLKELTESILVSYQNFEEECIVYDADEVWLNVETAISVGLIANELITNSFKHAFSDIQEPKLQISFKRSGSGFVLCVQDNGKGMKEHTADTFGLELIGLLTKQLKGNLVKRSEPGKGSSFSVAFGGS